MKKNALRLALATAVLAALPAAAQTSPWYTGLSLGQSITSDELVSNRESTISNATNINTSFDDKDTAWRFLVGYRFLPWLQVEANYADYGSSRMDTRFNVPTGATTVGGVATDRQVKGFGGDVVLSLPVMDTFSIFGRVGYFRAETRAKAELSGDTFFTDGLGGTSRENTSKENITKFGAGAEWMFTPQIGARLEWERLNGVGKKFSSGENGATGEADMDAWSVGVVWRF